MQMLFAMKEREERKTLACREKDNRLFVWTIQCLASVSESRWHYPITNLLMATNTFELNSRWSFLTSTKYHVYKNWFFAGIFCVSVCVNVVVSVFNVHNTRIW